MGWACPLSHIPGVKEVSRLWAFHPHLHGEELRAEGELNLNPAPGWLTLGLSWWGAVEGRTRRTSWRWRAEQ